MLSVNKINAERKEVSQKLTKEGLRKPNVPKVIEAIALTLDLKAYVDESTTIDKQIAIMDREIKEKKLLDYKLRNDPQNVSNFLANKYSEGNFNRGVVDRYDNSEERKKHGITFDYHVYFKPDKRIKSENRGHNKFTLSDTIIDRSVGDSYTYHVPVWLDHSGDHPFYVTDYGEIVSDPKSRGLLWALRQLKNAIEGGRFQIEPEAETVLNQWGFLDNGKIIHDIKNGVMVEKYLKSFNNEDKKLNAVQYLDTMVKVDNEYEDDWWGDYDPDILTKVDDGAKDITEPDDPLVETVDVDVQPIKTMTVPPGDYKDMTIYKIAKANQIPIVTYDQLRTAAGKPLVSELYVFIEDTIYRVRLRTGSPKLRLDHLAGELASYEKRMKDQIEKGVVSMVEMSKPIQELLKSKGFTALVDGKHPNMSINGFSTATTN